MEELIQIVKALPTHVGFYIHNLKLHLYTNAYPPCPEIEKFLDDRNLSFSEILCNFTINSDIKFLSTLNRELNLNIGEDLISIRNKIIGKEYETMEDIDVRIQKDLLRCLLHQNNR